MRLMRLFTAFLLLTSGLAGAGETDRACSENRNTSSPINGDLKVLSSCVKSFGKPKTKIENTRDNIKFVDNTLACYQQRNEAFSKAVDKYQSKCLVLLKSFCNACPPMDVVNNSVMGVQVTGAESDIMDALVRSQQDFIPFGRVVSGEEGDLACGSQIIALTQKIRQEHYATIRRFGNTKCDK